MLNAWVYALSVEKWSDMTVVVDENQMKQVDCGEESGGEAQAGWDCIFKPMSHLCTFPSAESWKEYMVSKDLPEADLVEAARLDQDAVRFHPEEIVASLEGSGVDHIAALAVRLWTLLLFVALLFHEYLITSCNVPSNSCLGPTGKLREKVSGRAIGLRVCRGLNAGFGRAAAVPPWARLGFVSKHGYVVQFECDLRSKYMKRI
ncbi:unnamed protein product [Ectocarpus sp. 12 AP-2014]